MKFSQIRKAVIAMLILPGAVFAENPTAPVPKTGQTDCYNTSAHTVTACTGTGQDGEHAVNKGGAVSPRFTSNNDGTVTDNLTGLTWLANANCTDTLGGIDPQANGSKWKWADALTWTAALKNGSCDLSDNSAAGDWRLPNIRELHSLIDFSQSDPAVPANYEELFFDVRTSYYWSSSTVVSKPEHAWRVNFNSGVVCRTGKSVGAYVWPVKGGQ